MPVAAMFLPSHTPVIDAGALAAATGLGLYTDGQRTALLPRRLPGWFKVGRELRDHRLMDDYELTEATAYVNNPGSFAA
jgi:hypothetical protein